MSLRRPRQPCYDIAEQGGGRARSVPGIADQRLARPEQQHQRMPSTPSTAKTGWSRITLTTLVQSQGAVPSTQVRNACWLD